ncbi:hypothetical protein, partial [Streptomyces xanthophaeus]|uniref:hypothetical protein n=1 Tax=Streptomyces xanthophaeus TaxID=67385 RepID=UPI0007C6CB27
MKDEEIRSRFDGRGRVELLPGRTTAAQQHRTEEIAHALGYRLLAVHNLGFAGMRLDFERDDTPVARRRNELTIARLRAGGPVLPAWSRPHPRHRLRRRPLRRVGAGSPAVLRRCPRRPHPRLRPDRAFRPR